MRHLLFLLAGALVLCTPALAQQVPPLETKIELVATPLYGWDADGFLDPASEAGYWAVNATVKFSPTAVCPTTSNITFAMGDASPYGLAIVDRPRAPVAVTPAGTVTVRANATLFLSASAPAGTTISVPLNATLETCPAPAGNLPSVTATVNLTVSPLPRPQIMVNLEELSSGSGSFNYSVGNNGNTPLLVTATLDVDASGLLEAVPLDPGESTSGTLRLAAPKPGSYAFKVEGIFNGEATSQIPSTVFEATLTVPEPAPPPAPKDDAPAPSLAVILLALVVAAMLRRQP